MTNDNDQAFHELIVAYDEIERLKAELAKARAENARMAAAFYKVRTALVSANVHAIRRDWPNSSYPDVLRAEEAAANKQYPIDSTSLHDLLGPIESAVADAVKFYSPTAFPRTHKALSDALVTIRAVLGEKGTK